MLIDDFFTTQRNKNNLYDEHNVVKSQVVQVSIINFVLAVKYYLEETDRGDFEINFD